ncbi:hypothetical protein K501DRAFT_337250 [Backusella circina FSU 941]|nr:hypothetical protein K501DRAFT_337250 [Backusella circina FSU 941]
MLSKILNKNLLCDIIGSSHIYLLICIILLVEKSYCSYPINIKDGSLKIPPFLSSASTVVYQDVIYAYGGTRFDHTDETAALYSYTLNNTTGEMIVSLVNLNEGPICSTCTVALYSDVGEIWVFSEPKYNANSKFYTNNISQEVHPIVVPHIYHIKNNSWSILPIGTINGNRSTFYERVHQTTVLGKDGTVYVLGGAYKDEILLTPINNGTAISPQTDTSSDAGVTLVITDGWYYNKTENSYNSMTLPTQDQYVYSAGFIDLARNLTLISPDDGYGETTLQVDYERKLLYTVVSNVWLIGDEQADSETSSSLFSASSI